MLWQVGARRIKSGKYLQQAIWRCQACFAKRSCSNPGELGGSHPGKRERIETLSRRPSGSAGKEDT
eukprot:15052470-Heterocapsa_arctica.AAC.1